MGLVKVASINLNYFLKKSHISKCYCYSDGIQIRAFQNGIQPQNLSNAAALQDTSVVEMCA